MKNPLPIAILITFLWFTFSLYVGSAWIISVAEVTNMFWSVIILSGIAFIPAIIISFIYSSIAFYKRPNYDDVESKEDISILIAAYNEEKSILRTLNSILNQNYNGNIEVIILNDGSVDNTKFIVDNFIKSVENEKINLIQIFDENNKGKSEVLNVGLKNSSNDIILTVDADSRLNTNAVQNIVNTLVGTNDSIVAVAGNIMVDNKSKNLVTQIQNWDYLLGISASKQSQSIYKSTLVAQGAFSAYYKKNLVEVGGWPKTVGEDIVLTWKILELGYNTSHCADAIAFTNVPETYKDYFNQRKRWSRGLIEAFKECPSILIKPRQGIIFIWYNALFPFLDFCVMFLLLPSIIAAIFFEFYLLVGLMTLLVLPLAMMLNLLMYSKQKKILAQNNIKLSGSAFSLLLFVIGYQLFQAPATINGYTSEFLNLKKNWGTK